MLEYGHFLRAFSARIFRNNMICTPHEDSILSDSAKFGVVSSQFYVLKSL